MGSLCDDLAGKEKYGDSREICDDSSRHDDGFRFYNSHIVRHGIGSRRLFARHFFPRWVFGCIAWDSRHRYNFPTHHKIRPRKRKNSYNDGIHRTSSFVHDSQLYNRSPQKRCRFSRSIFSILVATSSPDVSHRFLSYLDKNIFEEGILKDRALSKIVLV